MSQAIITISDLKYRVDNSWILNGINLSIKPQEILGIIGPSGCGKTTLLRNILMLNEPTSGDITVFGYPIRKCSPSTIKHIQHRWGVLFQHNALFTSMTVLENVMYPLTELTCLPKDLIRQIALLKINLAGLDVTAAHKYPSELSGGMAKRAALARALALDPKLLILDEPTAGLDPASARQFDKLITQLQKTLGFTILMVTHDIVTLYEVGGRLAFLGQGKILAIDSIDKLVKHDHPLIKRYFNNIHAIIRPEEHN